jgi:hypothetical protein
VSSAIPAQRHPVAAMEVCSAVTSSVVDLVKRGGTMACTRARAAPDRSCSEMPAEKSRCCQNVMQTAARQLHAVVLDDAQNIEAEVVYVGGRHDVCLHREG